jgi:casein kinase 1
MVLTVLCGDAPVGIPNIMWLGIEGDYNVLVLDLLGWILEDMFNFYNQKLSLKTMLMLANQLAGYLQQVCLQ